MKKTIMYGGFVIICLLGIMMSILNQEVLKSGEISSYVVPLISLKNHFSEWITLEDIEEAKLEFPELSSAISKDELFIEGSKVDEDLYRGYYSPIYSLLTVPIQKILEFFGVSKSYAFAVTNIFLLIGSVVFFCFMVGKKDIIIFCILVFNPIFGYVRWVSSEVYIYAMLLISIAFFLKRNYKLSFLFSILAASFNISAIIWGMIICIVYFYEKCLKFQEKSYLLKIKKFIILNWKTILYFFIVGCIGIYNFYGFSTSELGGENFVTQGYFNRVISYILDCNIGLLPYYGTFFFVFSYCFIKLIKAKDYKLISLGIAFFSILAAYSLKEHIHSGCNLIARYNAWNSVFMIVLVIEVINKVFIKKKLYMFVLISMIYVWSIMLIYNPFRNNASYEIFTPFANYILEKMPSFYIGSPEIFITRCRGWEEKIIVLDEPAIYENKDGKVIKVVITVEDISELNNYIKIDDNKMNDIIKKYEKSKEKYAFLSFSPEENIICCN